MLLVIIAVVLALEMGSLLIGEGAVPERMASIRDAIEATSGVGRVIDLRTLYLGPDELLVVAKIGVAPDMPAAELAALLDRAEVRIREVTPVAAVIYLEPDVDRTPARPVGE